MTAEATALSEATGPYFGRFGGRFVPEALVAALEQSPGRAVVKYLNL